MIALNRIRANPQYGKGMAIAGVVCSIIGLIYAIVVIAIGTVAILSII
jgi:hypothetical protein